MRYCLKLVKQFPVLLVSGVLYVSGLNAQTNTVHPIDDPGADVGSHTSIAIGSDGFPVVSYRDLTHGSLRVAKCSDVDCLPEGITTALVDDPSNQVGFYTAIAIGTDGFPVIAYHEGTDHSVKFAKCDDLACSGTGEIITTLEEGPLDEGQYIAVAIGTDGWPIISYHVHDNDLSTGWLKVIKCNDASCTGEDETITTIDSSSDDVGEFTDIAIGLDGLPVISYWDRTNGSLKVAKCNDHACTDGGEIITAVDDPANRVGSFTSIAIGHDGYPVISYRDVTEQALKVAKCNDVACTGGGETITTVDDPANNVAIETSIVVGADNFPIISYRDETDGNLKVVKCNDIACAGGGETITVVDDSSDRLGSYSEIVIGTDDLPVISYFDSTGGALKVAKCNDVACSSGDEDLIFVPKNPDGVGWENAIAIGTDGFPVIAYTAFSREKLMVAKCGDANCTPGLQTVSYVDNNTYTGPSIAIGTDGFPVIGFFDTTYDELKVVKCNDAACSGADEGTAIVDSVVGGFSSIAIGSDGLPIISYLDWLTENLMVAHCNDAACSGGDELVSVVDDSSGSGYYSSMAIGTDNLPVIAYVEYDTQDVLKVAKCNDLACSGDNETITVVDTDGGGEGLSIAIGLDGFPIIAYTRLSGELMVAKCNDPACSGQNEAITILDDGDIVFPSITIAPDGWPIIGYENSLSQAVYKIVKCNDAACAGGNETFTLVDENGAYLDGISMAIGGDGLPVFTVYDWERDLTLDVAHCGSANCVRPCNEDAYESLGSGGSDDSCHGAPISDGATQTHTHCDVDWVRFYPAPGHTYQIETSNLLNNADTVITLFGNCGSELDSDDDGGEGYASKLTWKALDSSPLDVSVASYSGNYVHFLNDKGYDISLTLLSETFEVNKFYSDGNSEPVTIDLVCTSGVVTTIENLASPGIPAVFAVDNADPGTTCTATESNVPAGYSKLEAGCVDVDLEAGGCIIINEKIEYFNVTKVYSDGNTTPVTVSLECSSGTVTAVDDQASPGNPAQFTVVGAALGTSCNATETGVPAGYVKDESRCIGELLEYGSCIITNTLSESTFTVYKDFIPNKPVTSVSIALICPGATVTNSPQTAFEGLPAEFNVTGYTDGTTCTATETNVPPGYRKFESGCQNVGLTTGACTITNKQTSFEFNVAKTYSDDNLTDVTVSLACTHGNIVTLDSTASPNDAANFRVDNAELYTTCIATELEVPANYSKDESDCLDVNIQRGGCTLVNTYAPTPPSAPSGLTAQRATGFAYLNIDLAWADNSSDESGFRIERKLPGESEFKLRRTLNVENDSNSMTHTDNTRTCGTTFDYQVRAFNGAGLSAPSNTASATTGTTSYCVSEKTSGSTATSTFGSEGSGDNQLSSPGGAETDADGNIVIADSDNNRVQICDVDGNCTEVDGTAGSVGAGQGGFAGFLDPQDVAVDGTGRIIVADTGNHRIAVCQGVICDYFGGIGSAVGQFDTPRGVAVDSAGRILVADTGNHRIQVCDNTGNCLAFGTMGTAFGQFDAPAGIAGGIDNGIWVADTGNHRIQRCDISGNCTGFGGFGQDISQFDGPTRIGIDLDERLVISDAGNQRVQLCNPDGVCTTLDGDYGTLLAVAIDDNGQIVVVDGTNSEVELLCLVTPESEFGSDEPWLLSNPKGVAVDSIGRTIIADTSNHRILVCEEGWSCTAFGQLGQAPSQFWEPHAVAVDSEDRIIVGDSRNSRIQICSDTGVCEAFGGPGSALGQFEDIRAVAVDSADRIIVADSYNHRIQVCDDEGNCTAFGSEGTSSGQFDRPSGVAVDSLDRILVADTGNDRVQVCSDIGACSAFGVSGPDWSEFDEPYGVAVDEDDRIIVSDRLNSRVQVCDDLGICFGFGQFGVQSGEFIAPSGVADGPDGSIVVVDTGNDRVQVMRECGPTNRSFVSGFEY